MTRSACSVASAGLPYAHSSSNVYRADGVGLSCLCVRALSCISCAKRARRLKIVLRSGNICTSVIAGSGRSVALRRCHTGNAPRSSSVNQPACRAGRLRAGRSRGEKGLLKASFYAIRAEKSRGGAPAPYRTVPRYLAPGGVVTKAYVLRTPSMHLDCATRSGSSLGANKNRFSRRNLCSLRGAAGRPIARCDIPSYALIVFLSTCSRNLSA